MSALLKKCFFCGTGIHDTVSWVLEDDDENLQSLLRGMDVNKIYKGKGRMKEFELTDEPMMPLFSEEPMMPLYSEEPKRWHERWFGWFLKYFR